MGLVKNIRERLKPGSHGLTKAERDRWEKNYFRMKTNRKPPWVK